MDQMGVVTAISDDAEMVRRLNQEAAKLLSTVGFPKKPGW